MFLLTIKDKYYKVNAVVHEKQTTKYLGKGRVKDGIEEQVWNEIKQIQISPAHLSLGF